MLAVLLTVLPPAVVLPIHGVVQAGSNAGRVITLRSSVQRSMLMWFTAGTVIGVIIASLVLVALPTRTLQVVLGLFIFWTVWGPKLGAHPIPDRGFLLVGADASFCTMFVGATGPSAYSDSALRNGCRSSSRCSWPANSARRQALEFSRRCRNGCSKYRSSWC